MYTQLPDHTITKQNNSMSKEKKEDDNNHEIVSPLVSKEQTLLIDNMGINDNGYDILPEKNKTDFNVMLYETLLDASMGGVTPHSLGLIIFVCLPLAGISSIIYYQPNINAALLVENFTGISEKFSSIILVGGSIATNFIFNAYFSYDVPKNIINQIKSIPWPLLPKSTLGKINYQFISKYRMIGDGFLGLLKLILKSIPVVVSTSQYVSLGADDGLSFSLLLSQLGAYGLMHWFAVTHFVENWSDSIVDVIKKPYLYFNTHAAYEKKLSDYRIKLTIAHKNTLNDALQTIRKMWQHGNSKELNDINLLFNQVISLKFRNDPEYALIFELELKILMNSKPMNTKNTHWVKLFSLYFINSCLTFLCGIGFHLSVWSNTKTFCQNIINNSDLCDNPYFIIPIQMLTIFPLGYLAAFVIAPENTKKIWNTAMQLHNKTYAKPLVLQRYPGRTYFLSGALLLLAIFSWGAPIMLNNKYILDTSLLWMANINSILYGTFFNAFAIPYVALTFAILGTRLWSKITKSAQQDIVLKETLEGMAIENFLTDLSGNINLLKPFNFLKQIEAIGDNEKISILFGNKQPQDILGEPTLRKTWIQTISFLTENHSRKANTLKESSQSTFKFKQLSTHSIFALEKNSNNNNSTNLYEPDKEPSKQTSSKSKRKCPCIIM